ncbi:MAG: Efflux transporter, family, subunit [Verrucomicrobiales bacterium]|nr:Efflux transporter, family, subunit [Verrucomicrobiales bacterium]
MKRQLIEFFRRQPRWRLITGAGVAALLLVWIFSRGNNNEHEITYAVKRGDLQISVLEGGSLEALESQEIRSEVKGTTKILKIVDEGYLVTPDDVKTGKVLVELESSEIKDRIVQQEIQFQTALASLTDATQGYEIQRNQNISNIKDADQKAQFARMDLEKFLGDKTGKEVIHLLRLDKLELVVRKLPAGEDVEQMMLSALETNETQLAEAQLANEKLTDEERAAKPELVHAALHTKAPVTAPPVIDYASYATAEKLGDGSAMQNLRKLMDDLQSAKQQAGLSETKLEGTKRLFAKGFATKTELDTDKISDDNNALKVKTAQTAYDLFIKYEFHKQAQDYVLKYEDSLRGLEREKKEAISKLAQARARMKGAESRYNIESSQRKELSEQIEKCSVKALKPGLVVYGGGGNENYYGNNEQIREGVSIRERQPLITIPDMTKMAVRVKVHESYIQKIEKGLSAKIQADAYPNKKLAGQVTKVALLPDSQNRWMNPDLKVYQTTVTITGTHDWLKPGMSAKVEILVRQLKDIIYVPLQAVSENNGKHYCQVINGRSEQREVKLGEFNDQFIEIKSGLNAGEKVSLRAPESDNKGDAEKPGDISKPAGSPKDDKKDAKPKPAGPNKKSDKKTAV